MQNLFSSRGLKLVVFGRGLFFFGRRHVSVFYSSLQRRLMSDFGVLSVFF